MPELSKILEKIERFKKHREEAERLLESQNSGEFLLECLPPELHMRVLELFDEIRMQVREADIEVQTLLAEIKAELKDAAAETFAKMDSGWSKVAVGGFEARPTRKFEYDPALFIRAAKERKSYEDMRRQGVLKEVVDEKRLKATVSEEERQYYNERALKCSLGNISVYDDKSAEKSKY